MKFRATMQVFLFLTSLLATGAGGPIAHADDTNIILQCYVSETGSHDGVDKPANKYTEILKITPDAWSNWNRDKAQWDSINCHQDNVTCAIQDTFLEMKTNFSDEVINRQTGKYTYRLYFVITDQNTNQTHTDIGQASGQCGPTSDPSLSTGQKQF